MEDLQTEFKEKIKNNINQYGHHITLVSDGAVPRFAYTIGVKDYLGIELIFAGGIYYMQEEIVAIINNIITQIKKFGIIDNVIISPYGSFKLSKVNHSWSELMMLGFFDYYKTNEVEAFQIIPDVNHITLDVPDMSLDLTSSSQAIWKWLSVSWDYLVPKNSKIITNIEALQGEKITEVMRWENDVWEAFAGAGPEVEEKDTRVVSIGTMLEIDPSLKPILDLEIGKGIWRDNTELIWHKWN